jgi:hypothetical protein
MALHAPRALRFAPLVAALALSWSLGRPALAQPAPPEPAAAQPAPLGPPAPAPAADAPPVQAPHADSGAPATPPKPLFADVQRPWLYSPDATAPPPGHVLASLGVEYADIDKAVGRPFAANLVHAGAVMTAGAELGVFKFASVHAEGFFAGTGGNVNAGALAGVTFYPTPAGFPVNVAISTGYLRELGGSDGVWGRVTAAGDLGPVRLAVSGLGAHVFAPGRDALDLLLTAGASYRVASFFRLGAEYVVQDLEGAWEEDEEEGGVRHFLSPTATLELYHRVRISAGPAFGLSPASPKVLGRLQAGFGF